jgi:hypothetical protein
MSTLNTYNLKSPDSANTNLALDASGNVAIQAGSASAPSIYVTGDINTGLYSPGADQVAVTTGGTARLFIDASGRLLVGTTTGRSNFSSGFDSAALQIEGTGTNRRFSITGADNASVLILARQRSGSAGGNTVLSNGDLISSLSFQGNDGTNFIEAAAINTVVDGTPGANDMPGRIVLSTTADGASSPTERMRIDNSGNVFVNTSTGSERLRVAGQVQIGNGTNGSVAGNGGGGYVRTTPFTASGTSHIIPDSSWFPNGNSALDNFAGLLIVTAKKLNTGSAVSVLAVTKRVTTSTSLTEISNKKDGITTFSVTNSGNSISVSTDADCVVCASFVGGF